MSEDLHGLLTKLKRIRIEEDDLLRKIEPSSHPAPSSPIFDTGDRVRITNKITKPASWTLPRDRAAVQQFSRANVTSVNHERVHLLTDIGVVTWRSAKNLEHTKA